MKVRTWIDVSQEVNVNVGVEDFQAAVAERFAELKTEGYKATFIIYAFDAIGLYLKAFTDEQIAMLNDHQRKVLHDFLTEQAARYAPVAPKSA